MREVLEREGETGLDRRNEATKRATSIKKRQTNTKHRQIQVEVEVYYHVRLIRVRFVVSLQDQFP